MKFLLILICYICFWTISFAQPSAFPSKLPEEKPDRPLSAAMERFYDQMGGVGVEANELFSRYKYTRLKGFSYAKGESRRDPSKVLKINGKYYVWYTRRTGGKPVGPDAATETRPSYDWDLAEIWYATSRDGITWKEQGVAVPRLPKPTPGWRSVSTPDILAFKGKYYLYYQAFMETPGKRGDFCPVSVSEADSPNGPWRPLGRTVVENGELGEWDQYKIHDPYPLMYRGKIYLYYKSDLNWEAPRPWRAEKAHGLAIADHPFGPFEKHSLNPVLNSGHETGYWPWKEGIATMVILNGPELNTIQYAPDGVNFEIASIAQDLPIAPGPYVPDAFTDNGDGRGITWGLCHLNPGGGGPTQPSILARFDCDLSLDYHYPEFKQNNIRPRADYFFEQGVTPELREELQKRDLEEPNNILK